MTTNKRLKLTHLIKKLTDESVEQLLKTAYKLFAAKRITQRPDCPCCQSSSIVKKGHKCGRQEYRCKECRKTFVSTTNTLMSNSHQSSETWEALIQDTISGESISYSARRLSISHDCTFHMRHKFLMSLEDVQTEHTVKLGGVSELDEIFVLDSCKGSVVRRFAWLVEESCVDCPLYAAFLSGRRMLTGTPLRCAYQTICPVPLWGSPL